MPATETLSAHRARIGRTARHHGSTHPATVEARREYAAASIEAYIRKIVDTAPPLTDEQRINIASLLRPTGAATAVAS